MCEKKRRKKAKDQLGFKEKKRNLWFDQSRDQQLIPQEIDMKPAVQSHSHLLDQNFK